MADLLKTPSTCRDPLTSITNTNHQNNPIASSSSAPPLKRRVPPPSTALRQTSIIDLFNINVDSTASSSRSSINSDQHRANSTSSQPSSPWATSPLRRNDDNDQDCFGMDGDEREEEERMDSKRQKIVSHEIVQGNDLRLTHERRIGSQFIDSGGQMGIFASFNRRMLGLKVGSRQISTRPFLQDIVSNNELNVFRCPSSHPYRSFAPPFACAFSHGAKAGGKQIFAIASEEGVVSLINGGEDSQFDLDHGRPSFQVHRNAIFDLAWSKDDRFIATASGDQCARITDVTTQQCLGVLAGHTCTLKNVAWDPFNPNLLATASRDGAIRIWDPRVAAANDPDGNPGVATVNLIKNAHGVPKGTVAKRSAVKSVTAVAYMHSGSHQLASSGSCDGIIKIWDLRKIHTKRKNPPFVENNEEAVAESIGGRPHGISSMVLSPDGRSLYALSTDSSIYAYDPNNLSSPAPLTVFRHPQACYGSFYIRLAVSPCSRYLASGSSDGGIYTWDVEGGGKDGVRLVGHEKEVGGVDWANNTIASCSDDNLVRVWNVNSKVAREARVDKTIRWRWSGESGQDQLT